MKVRGALYGLCTLCVLCVIHSTGFSCLIRCYRGLNFTKSRLETSVCEFELIHAENGARVFCMSARGLFHREDDYTAIHPGSPLTKLCNQFHN